jgi:DNA-binding NarL/FixJ family response regulator
MNGTRWLLEPRVAFRSGERRLNDSHAYLSNWTFVATAADPLGHLPFRGVSFADGTSSSEGVRPVCPVSVLIADDHEIVRRGLRALIQEEPGWQVVAEVTNGRDAVVKANELKHDVAILDISMPSLNGLDATKQIAKLSPQTKVLILTVHDADQLISKVLGGGARGYILKADAGGDLITAVKALLANKTFFTSRVAQILMDGYLGKAPKSSEEEFSQLLTGRESEIVQLLAEGKCCKEVATILGISTKTADKHRSNLMRKLNCHSVTEIVRYAIRNHLLEA